MKIQYSLVVVLLVTLFSSCKQDFDITSDYKEIPVVYGLLNHQENTHYIRIQKGFLIDGNALVAAGVADSVYYPDVLTVKLVPYFNGNPSGTPFTLTRVDGDNLGLPKDSGTFANSPNILYTFNGALDVNKTYRLEVSNGDNGYKFKSRKNEDSLEITLVKDFLIIAPFKKGDKISLQNEPSAYSIKWYDAENAGIYDVNVRFFYKEYKLSDNSLYRDTFVDIPFLKSYLVDYASGHINVVEFTSSLVLNYLANNIKSDIEVIREFNTQKGMQFMFAAGGAEMAKFMKSQQAQGGLASNETLPPYTNIDGGVGLLSSRYFKQMDSVLLTVGGLDSLACSDISRGLRFKNHSGVVCP